MPMLTNGPLLAAQLADRVVGGPALGGLAFDLGDHVAAADALVVGRRALEHPHGGDVAVGRLDGDAEPVVAPFLPLAHLRVAARVHEARVRIERLEHAVDGAVDQAVGLDFLGVLRLDGGQGRREGPVVLRDAILASPGRWSRTTRRDCRAGDGKHDGHNGRHPHRAMLTNNPPPGKDFPVRGGVYSYLGRQGWTDRPF